MQLQEQCWHLTPANLSTDDLLKDLKERGLELPRVHNLLCNYSVRLSGVMGHTQWRSPQWEGTCSFPYLWSLESAGVSP